MFVGRIKVGCLFGRELQDGFIMSRYYSGSCFVAVVLWQVLLVGWWWWREKLRGRRRRREHLVEMRSHQGMRGRRGWSVKLGSFLVHDGFGMVGLK